MMSIIRNQKVEEKQHKEKNPFGSRVDEEERREPCFVPINCTNSINGRTCKGRICENRDLVEEGFGPEQELFTCDECGAFYSIEWIIPKNKKGD